MNTRDVLTTFESRVDIHDMRKDLIAAVRMVDVQHLPVLTPVRKKAETP